MGRWSGAFARQGRTDTRVTCWFCHADRAPDYPAAQVAVVAIVGKTEARVSRGLVLRLKTPTSKRTFGRGMLEIPYDPYWTCTGRDHRP